VAGRAFADANQDGRFGAGEKPVAGVTLQAGSASAVTDANGRYELSLEPGTHTVRIAATSVPFGYQVEGPTTFTVSLGPRRRVERDISLISSGRVEGRLDLKGPPETRPPLDGVTIVLASAGTRRTAVTDQDGDFSFGNVPPGTYRLSVEEETLGEFYGIVGPAEREIRVDADRAASVTFEIRRLTTRERLERRQRRE
jgi:protocatechuate 3,4-dioxygenase beta subunit